MRVLRPLVALSVLLVSGCVYPPAPVPVGTVVAGTQCFAGFYQCPVASQPVGTPCACPGLGAPSYGTVR